MSMDKLIPDCPYPGCFFCVMKEGNPNKRRTSVMKFFRELPSQDDDGQVLPISGLWNTAMAHPNNPEFIELGIFECLSALIWKGLKNRRWLSHDQNIYIPYYAAHIIGSYTMNMEDFAKTAVNAGVIPPLVELLRGRLTWVEQRVAVRALGHLATYASTFSVVASHGEILELCIQLAMSSLEIVYSHFYQHADRRLGYHCDLLTRGMGGVEMESRKAEEWASQLQCWSLQLINCFAFKPDFLSTICKPEFLVKLPGLWGGLVNENSPAGIGLLRTICHHKFGRGPVSSCPGVIDALCNIARSSDDWQYMAIDCLLWLLQDPNTFHKVVEKAAPAVLDLAEISALGNQKKLGDLILNVLQECIQSHATGRHSISNRIKEDVEEILHSRVRFRWEKSLPKEDRHIKQAAALVVKLEGNSLFSSGNISGAALKYSEALALCPNKVPDYAERLVKKQMRAAWLFREAAVKHGGIDFEADGGDVNKQATDDSEWETASESDVGHDDRNEIHNDDGEWENDDEIKGKNDKNSTRASCDGTIAAVGEESVREEERTGGHDVDTKVAMAAVISLGLIGAGTNNARIAGVNTFNTPGVEENCHYLKEVEDAQKIRRTVIDCFEKASLPTLSDVERKKNASVCCWWWFDKRITTFAKEKFHRDGLDLRTEDMVVKVSDKEISTKVIKTG
ncbi:hypothetical protein R6Q57_003634, partial [Mikania cordata]